MLLGSAARAARGLGTRRAAAAPQGRGLRLSARVLEAFVVKVPPMGEAVKHGDLVEWLKKEGDAVKMDEVICVLETDKVTVDIRTPVAGVLVKQMAKKDETVNTDQPIAAIEQSVSGVASAATTATTPAAAAQAKAAAPAPAAAVVTSDAHSLSTRRPSIHFRYGKRDEMVAPAASTAAAALSAPAAVASSPPAGSTARPVKTVYIDLPPIYGRLPPLTEKEALRLQLGGADP
jgi:pyruvate/2-oxoglutarate dehydrogenase complex dihydrolipoamide acyltransferase (E2) component